MVKGGSKREQGDRETERQRETAACTTHLSWNKSLIRRSADATRSVHHEADDVFDFDDADCDARHTQALSVSAHRRSNSCLRASGGRGRRTGGSSQPVSHRCSQPVMSHGETSRSYAVSSGGGGGGGGSIRAMFDSSQLTIPKVRHQAGKNSKMQQKGAQRTAGSGSGTTRGSRGEHQFRTLLHSVQTVDTIAPK